MTSSNLYKRLTKYFSGESSSEEVDKINRWLEKNDKNRIIFEEVKSIWLSTNLPVKSFDKDKAWQNVISSAKNSSRDNNNNREKISFRIGDFNIRLLKVAASIAFFIVLSLWGINNFTINSSIKPNNTKIISASKNEIRRIRLVDGSVVTLNSESRLTVPDNFNESQRSIKLSGEAYFEITPNKLKPFNIFAHGANVTVVGTKFNLTAWDEDSEITVAVTEGTVEFNSASEEEKNSVFVSEGEVSSISKGSPPLVPIKLEVEKYYLFWLNDELNFYNASFKSVIQRLEMKYNVDIAVEDISILSKHLTANFKNEPLSEILNTISIALSLGYSVNENKVVFNFLKPSSNN